MRRVLLVRAGAALVAFTLLLAGAAITIVAAEPHPAEAQSGALVSDEELCAFRAPLALTKMGEIPPFCADTVAWLRRVTTRDPACAELWIETGAIPACAHPYR